MNASRKLINRKAVEFQTWLSRDRVKDIIAMGQAMDHDIDKVARIKACHCLRCHYGGPSIAGQAFTGRQCGICAKEMMFSSTDTDVLCPECAKEHDICKHCGADRELRPHRRKYAFEPVPEPPRECPGCIAVNRNYLRDCPVLKRLNEARSSVMMLPKRQQ